VQVAPDNLTAIRALADIPQPAGELPDAPEHPAVAALEHWLAAIVADRSRVG